MVCSHVIIVQNQYLLPSLKPLWEHSALQTFDAPPDPFRANCPFCPPSGLNKVIPIRVGESMWVAHDQSALMNAQDSVHPLSTRSDVHMPPHGDSGVANSSQGAGAQSLKHRNAGLGCRESENASQLSLGPEYRHRDHDNRLYLNSSGIQLSSLPHHARRLPRRAAYAPSIAGHREAGNLSGFHWDAMHNQHP